MFLPYLQIENMCINFLISMSWLLVKKWYQSAFHPKCNPGIINFFKNVFSVSKITADSDCRHEIKRCLLLGGKVITSLASILQSRDITLPTKVHIVKAMIFSVVMYGCGHWIIKKSMPKNWCFQILALNKTLDSSLDCKEIKPVNPNGNQPWIHIGRTDAEPEAPVLWLPYSKCWLIGKD